MILPAPILLAPPPWTLTGEGFIFICHFPEAFVRQQGFLAPYQQQGYKGYIGTVMLVDYQTSAVGPYQELLFIPGLVRLADRTAFSIAKIYVSTYNSVWNGIENWGIPKELADFSITRQSDGSTIFAVGLQGVNFFSAQVQPWSFRFPINTNWLPGFQVLQQQDCGVLLTKPTAVGKARLASLRKITVNKAYFPDISQVKPLAVLAVEDFTMTFPVALRPTP